MAIGCGRFDFECDLAFFFSPRENPQRWWITKEVLGGKESEDVDGECHCMCPTHTSTCVCCREE